MKLNPEALAEKTRDDLKNLEWFAKEIGDLIYMPGATQESFEDDLRTLRAAYQEKNIDSIFMQYFDRIRDAIKDSVQYADTGLTLRIPYTADDFLYTEAPYAELAAETNPFKQEQILSQLDKMAKSVGVKNFRTLWKQYDKNLHKESDDGRQFLIPVQDLQLNSAGWHMDASGIWKEGKNGQEYACTHPIAPIRRLTNIDTGEEKLTIAYERSGCVREITKSKRELFDSAKILDLAAIGVSVTSKSAKVLSEYIREIEDANYDEIPHQDSVSRLGWLPDGRFSPYVEDVVFDGDTSYGRIFKAIQAEGNFETWKKCAVKYREKSIIVRMELAASFASVLIEKLEIHPFFLHLWGGGSTTGKSTVMKLAAAVWGNPEIGDYVQTFNGTITAHEMVADFLRNVPMFIDEGQLKNNNFSVYQLAEGTGKARGRKDGGVREQTKWSLCMITNGERPIVSESDGEGALARVIDIECKPGNPIFQPEEFDEVLKTSRQNYGHAGRKFIENLTDDRLAEAMRTFKNYQKALMNGDKNGKQVVAAAALLTADWLADVIIFKTGKWLTVDEISQFLKSKKDISVGERGYSFMCDWVAFNVSKFSAESKNDCYGMIDGDYAYINRSVFRKACNDNGFDERALLSWMKAEGLILTRGQRLTRGKRIAGVNVECVAMRMPDCGVAPEIDDNELI